MPRDIDIDIERKGACSVMRVRGEVNWNSSPEFRAALLDLFENRGQELVVVDLAEVQRMESSGVSILVEGLHAANKRKAHLILAGLSKEVRHILELTRLARVFEITETVAQALNSRAKVAA